MASAPQRGPIAVLKEVWEARDLLRNLIAKELTVRYKGSVLGFAWTLVTPLMLAAIFTVVFLTFLRVPFGENGDFTTFFLSGYLAWQFFQNSVMASATSIIANGALVKKVYFPREVLPLSLVISQLVHFCLALIATSPLFMWNRGFHPEVLPYLVLALIITSMFTAGMSMAFGALTVRFRDLNEFLPVLMQAWFYLTPVIYSLENVKLIDAANGSNFERIIRFNPASWFVEMFHTILYGIPLPPDRADYHPPPGSPALTTWLVCTVLGVVVLIGGWWLFRRQAVSFAKEV